MIHPELVLVDAEAVADDRVPESWRRYLPALHAVVDWAWSYLCEPHDLLGRRGAVCPYARAALTAHTFFLAVRPGRPGGPHEVAELLGRYRDWFVDLEPTTGREAELKTILVLFPDLTPPDWPVLVDASQRLLKAEYVERGFMIGEFHDGPPGKPGLRNDAFRPLRSPVPMLVIRHMVVTDLAFLDADRQHFEAYVRRFGADIPAGLQARFLAAAARFELDLARGGSR